MRHDQGLQKAKSVRDLKLRMASNPVYQDRHYHRGDVANQHFLATIQTSWPYTSGYRAGGIVKLLVKNKGGSCPARLPRDVLRMISRDIFY